MNSPHEFAWGCKFAAGVSTVSQQIKRIKTPLISWREFFEMVLFSLGYFIENKAFIRFTISRYFPTKARHTNSYIEYEHLAYISFPVIDELFSGHYLAIFFKIWFLLAKPKMMVLDCWFRVGINASMHQQTSTSFAISSMHQQTPTYFAIGWTIYFCIGDLCGLMASVTWWNQFPLSRSQSIHHHSQDFIRVNCQY